MWPWPARWRSKPDVLLLDEPLSALDAKVRVRLRDEIRAIQQELGITTVFVTHDQEEALAVADRVGVMSKGRLEQLAAPADLYANPATRFVAEFVGLNNLVRAHVENGTAHVRGRPVPTIDGSLTSGSGHAMVRPESLVVTEGDGTGNAGVVSVNFLGPISRVYCLLDEGEQQVMAQIASSQAARLSPGDRVTVSVEPTPLLVVEPKD